MRTYHTVLSAIVLPLLLSVSCACTHFPLIIAHVLYFALSEVTP